MIARFIAKLLPSGNLKHRFEDVDEVNRLPIAEAGVSDDGTPFIRLQNGPIFFGYLPAKIHKLIYYLLAFPSFRRTVPVAAYKVAWDILHRYWQGGQCNQQAHYTLKPGDTVVEAGAFMGYYTLKAAQDVGPSGHVICIEPVEGNRALITRNLRANGVQNVTVVPCAVSNEKTTANFYVQNWQKNSLSPDVCKGDTREIRVEVNTIDDIVAERGIGSPSLVILTVNGFELEALQGMEAVLEGSNVNLVVAAKYVVNGRPVLDTVLEFLHTKGYEVILDRYGFVKNEDPRRQAVVYARRASEEH